ncbi:MAG: hypothetical protein JWN30_1062 [Bacilli bacterium]|nr:hypothetical protein [Bacilli bacterium]
MPLITHMLQRGPVNAGVVLAHLAGYLIPICFVFGQVLLHPLYMYVGSNEDAGQFMWYLGWFWHAVVSGHHPFVTNLENFPGGVNLMANTSLVAEAIVFGPLLYLVNSVFAFNCLLFADMLTIGLLATLILRKLGCRQWLALFGGILLETCPYFINQLVDGHANLVTGPVFVLAILYLIVRIAKAADRPNAWTGFMIGLLAALMFYTSLEVFAVAVLIALLMSLLFLLFDTGELVQFLKRASVRTGVSAAVTITVLISPGIYLFFAGPFHFQSNLPLMPVDQFVTDLLNLVIPTNAQWLHNHATDQVTSQFTGGLSEQDAYLGLPALILLVWAATLLWRIRYARALCAGTLLIVILSMGSQLHLLGMSDQLQLPWSLLVHLPLIGNALPSRFMLYAFLLFILVASLCIERVLSEGTQRWQTLYAAGWLGLVLVTWLPAVPFWHQTVPASAKSIEPGGKLYQLLAGHPTAIICLDYWHFGYYMGILADTHYAFPVTNVYGFPYTTASMANQLEEQFPNQFLFTNQFKDSKQSPVNQLKNYIATRKPERFVYLDEFAADMSASLEQALTIVCGKPVTDGSAMVWIVP